MSSIAILDHYHTVGLTTYKMDPVVVVIAVEDVEKCHEDEAVEPLGEGGIGL